MQVEPYPIPMTCERTLLFIVPVHICLMQSGVRIQCELKKSFLSSAVRLRCDFSPIDFNGNPSESHISFSCEQDKNQTWNAEQLLCHLVVKTELQICTAHVWTQPKLQCWAAMQQRMVPCLTSAVSVTGHLGRRYYILFRGKINNVKKYW